MQCWERVYCKLLDIFVCGLEWLIYLKRNNFRKFAIDPILHYYVVFTCCLVDSSTRPYIVHRLQSAAGRAACCLSRCSPLQRGARLLMLLRSLVAPQHSPFLALPDREIARLIQATWRDTLRGVYTAFCLLFHFGGRNVFNLYLYRKIGWLEIFN